MVEDVRIVARREEAETIDAIEGLEGTVAVIKGCCFADSQSTEEFVSSDERWYGIRACFVDSRRNKLGESFSF